MDVKSRKSEQAEATRTALLAEARSRFADRGYAATSIEEIAQAVRVTKGALYHHFADKRDLFRAVHRQLQSELEDRVAAAAGAHDDLWERLRTACLAYLDACLENEVQRLVVMDAPAVLGWTEWCRIDKEYGVRMLEDLLRDAIQAGVIAPDESVESLAVLILGTINTGGRVIAESDDVAGARARVGATLDRLLSGLHSTQTDR
jgi:AcrR family transcriptional regulator